MKTYFRSRGYLFCSLLLLTACSGSIGNIRISRDLPGETEDPSRYLAIMDEAGDHPALAHFPASIPSNAEDVNFYYQPAVFQGGTVLQLRVRFTRDEVDTIYPEFLDRAEFVYGASIVNDGILGENEVPTTKFYASGGSSTEFPESFEILVFGSEDLGSEDAPWNHGVSYGAAINLVDSEVVYWYED